MPDRGKVKMAADLLESFLLGRISTEQAREQAKELREITADDLAVAEQELSARGIDDDTVYSNIESFLLIFEDVLRAPVLELPDWHPICIYQRENGAVLKLLEGAATFSRVRFIKNRWAELIEKLSQYKIHLSRKQNQLYPALERQGFDRPSKIMWSLDDKVQGEIRKAEELLENSEPPTFLKQYDVAVSALHELIEKENAVLYPTAVEMISDEEFTAMRVGDEEIGYFLISPPPISPTPAEREHENKSLDGELDLRQGKLTLEQINLIFRHLPVDLSFVDEHELVRFYSDTKHRIFPRSPGVIGRDVKNCHPRESVGNVMEIIKTFREGSHDEAEFWLEMNGKFIYILYIAVRDSDGVFRGILEMMQDATHIRSLEGNRRLLNWDNSTSKEPTQKENVKPGKSHKFRPETTIGEVVRKYPAIRAWLPTVSAKYKKILNPLTFKAMSGIADLEMIAKRGDLELEDLLSRLDEWIDTQSGQL